MDTKALKQKILDLAIRGKLVPQDPNDEPASVLLEKIRAEKQQMVKDGMLKSKDLKNDTVIFVGEDNLHYEKFSDGTIKCLKDEIPFEVPAGWIWCRLKNISTTNIGLNYHPEDINDQGVAVLRSNNIKDNVIDYSDLVKVNCAIKDNQYLNNHDILICSRNGSKNLVGKCAVYEGDPERFSFGAFMAVLRTSLYEYVYYYLLTNVFRKLFHSDDSKQINQVTQTILKEALIPLPPFQEQSRISSAIKSLFSYVDSFDANIKELTEIVSQTRSKILDLAIRGKLVPQDSDDEPATVLLERIRRKKEELIKAGKLKRDKRESVIFRGEDNSYYETIGNKRACIDSEIHYDIPEGWTVERLKNLYSVNPKNDIANDETIVSFVPMNLINDRFLYNCTYELKQWKDCKKGFTHFADGDLGFAKISPCFENRKSVVFSNLKNGYGAGTTELYILRNFCEGLNPEYAILFLKSESFIERGVDTYSGTVGQQRIDKNLHFALEHC